MARAGVYRLGGGAGPRIVGLRQPAQDGAAGPTGMRQAR